MEMKGFFADIAILWIWKSLQKTHPTTPASDVGAGAPAPPDASSNWSTHHLKTPTIRYQVSFGTIIPFPKKNTSRKNRRSLRLNLCPNERFIKPTPKHFRPIFGVLFVATIFLRSLKVRAERRSVAVTPSSEGSVTFRTGKVQHASAARSW